jgi:hypothetical protein
MRHLTDGTLRRLADEPDGVTRTSREHLASCPACRSRMAAAQDDARFVATALATAPATPDTDVSWRRLSHALGSAPATASSPRAFRRRAGTNRRPLVAAATVGAVLVGGSVAAATNWLEIFRAERVAPVEVSSADVDELAGLPELESYGDVDVVDPPQLLQPGDAASAEEATGLALPEVASLPRGVTGEPEFRAVDEASMVFTFREADARAAAAAAGADAPPVPEGLDGAQFRISAGPAVATVWESTSGLPALVVARAVAPAVDSTGVPFETARDYILSLPGVPESVAAQLRTLTGDASTLPLLVPAEAGSTSTADVNGVPATVVTSRDRALAGVVWVQDGTITAVAGSVGADELLAVARNLR